MLDVIKGKDPVAERKAQRLTGTFTELANAYVERHARKNNKSWRQADALVRRHLIPRWGKLKANSITGTDVRAVMASMTAPIVANQVLASASAIFTWAVRQEIVAINPCVGVDRNPTTERERVLSDAEVRLLWPRLDHGLKLILLTAQRPGEVAAMQAAHIVDGGWWQLPGKPQGDWAGTKNGRDHRVSLSEPAQGLVEIHLTKPTAATTSAKRLRTLVAELGSRTSPRMICGAPRYRPSPASAWPRCDDRIANHKKGGVTDVYDRHSYAAEDRRIMAAVARHLLDIAEGRVTSNVRAFKGDVREEVA